MRPAKQRTLTGAQKVDGAVHIKEEDQAAAAAAAAAGGDRKECERVKFSFLLGGEGMQYYAWRLHKIQTALATVSGGARPPDHQLQLQNSKVCVLCVRSLLISLCT
jgi:hypothetical protein